MTEQIGTEVVADFEITAWDESVYQEGDGMPKLARTTVHKTFRGGVEGTSVTELLSAAGTTGRGYVASEYFTGTIDGRRGTVVFQHGGLDDAGTLRSFGSLVPGTGTEDLAGVRGDISYLHEGEIARAALRLY